jgi:hypothetical protein
MEFTKEQSSSVMERNSIRKNSKSPGSPGSFGFEREFFEPEVLVVHEDSPTGVRAREALNNLANQLKIKICFLISLCRFGMLEDAELAESALQKAKRADIVFLSLHGNRELSTAVRNWLLRWLETRDFKPCALVVSLDSSTRDSQSNSTWNFLRVITAPLEVDLMLHLGGPPFMAKCQERLGMKLTRNSSFCFKQGNTPKAPERHSG